MGKEPRHIYCMPFYGQTDLSTLQAVVAGRCNGHYFCWSVRPLGFHSVIRVLTHGLVSADQGQS